MTTKKKAAPKAAKPAEVQVDLVEAITPTASHPFDDLQVGQQLNIDGRTMRIIGLDAETVTFNNNGVPATWQRQWLNDYPKGRISIL